MTTTPTSAPTVAVAPFARVSRAVGRLVEPGNDADCSGCGEPIKFAARRAQRQVIANVYVDERWNRVEHWHDPCYEAAGAPYGPAAFGQPPRRRAS